MCNQRILFTDEDYFTNDEDPDEEVDMEYVKQEAKRLAVLLKVRDYESNLSTDTWSIRMLGEPNISHR